MLKLLCIFVVEMVQDIFHDVRLIGNRVQIPSSPAAVSFNTMVFDHNHGHWISRSREGCRKPETSQKTCRFLYLFNCLRGRAMNEENGLCH